MCTGFIYSKEFLKHVTGAHPECGNRLLAILGRLEKMGITYRLQHIDPVEADLADVALIHTPDYIKRVKALSETGRAASLDADTLISPGSYRAALLAAGAVTQAIDKVISGEWGNAFCAVRPPGHHAEKSRGMGFCLFNNVAVGAKYAVFRKKLKRVLVLDWDVHHGNGTQNSFYSDPRVLYISLHEYPHYPGSGASGEKGEGDGEGFTLNIPLPAGLGESEYLAIFKTTVLSRITEYKPELILVSAGFDAHKADTLASLNISSSGFGKLTEMLMLKAAEECGGKVVSVLEGGYDLRALGESVCEHISVMADFSGY